MAAVAEDAPLIIHLSQPGTRSLLTTETAPDGQEATHTSHAVHRPTLGRGREFSAPLTNCPTSLVPSLSGSSSDPLIIRSGKRKPFTEQPSTESPSTLIHISEPTRLRRISYA